MSERLEVVLPEAVVEAIAERAAVIVLERLEERPPRASEFMTVAEVAELLRCKRQRIDDLLSQSRLSRVKEGSRTLLRRAEVEAMLVVEEARAVVTPLSRGSRSGSQRGVAA